METSLRQMNRSPIALVVDDDWAELRHLERAFLNATAIGVLCVDHLRDAADVIEAQNYDIAAVVADLRIDPPKRDSKRRLGNGIDFLKWLSTQKSKPNAAYVHSVDGSDPNSVNRATAAWGNSRIRFFQKSQLKDTDPNSPWACIERDYLASALKQNPELQRRVEQSGCNVVEASLRLQDDSGTADKVRIALDAHRISYINTLPDVREYNGITIKRPIEVLCRKERINGAHRCTARSISIGILSQGEGDTMFDALDDLRMTLIEEYREFSKKNPEEFVGYATHIWSQMKEYLTTKK
jgi:hypothetical protein